MPMPNGFIDVLHSGHIHYLESAVQSGSNRILKLMNRKYTVEEYRDAINRIRQEVRNIELRTQIIVNFPGETQEDFQATMALIDDMRFDMIELYDFRPEPNTPAI